MHIIEFICCVPYLHLLQVTKSHMPLWVPAYAHYIIECNMTHMDINNSHRLHELCRWKTKEKGRAARKSAYMLAERPNAWVGMAWWLIQVGGRNQRHGKRGGLPPCSYAEKRTPDGCSISFERKNEMNRVFLRRWCACFPQTECIYGELF